MGDLWGIRSHGVLHLYTCGNNNFANGVRVWKFNEATGSFGSKYGYVFSDGTNGNADYVWGSGPEDVWVSGWVGDRSVGRLYRFDGATWRRVTEIGEIGAVTGISGTGSQDVWVATRAGRIYHYGSPPPPVVTSVAVTPANQSLQVGQSVQMTATGTFSDGSSRVLTAGDGMWSPKARMNTPGAGLSSGVVNGVLYVAGGTGSPYSNTGTLQAYDPATDTWATKAAMPTPRGGGTAAAVVNGLLYIIGGHTGISGVGTVEAYNPATNTWITGLSSMPTPRWHPMAGVANGKIYVMGGFNGSTTLTTVEEYNPATNTWRTGLTPLPTRRATSVVATVNNQIYVVGGNDLNFYNATTTQTVDAYNPGTDSWTTGLAPMPGPRSSAVGALLDGLIYVVGGNDQAGTGLHATVQAYDPVGNVWYSRPPLSTGRLTPGVGAIGGRLYVAGGLISPDANGYSATVEAFTPSEVTWATSPPGFASIDADGLVTGASPGLATITATSGGVSGSTPLTVTPTNSPPVANAGQDQVVECDRPDGASVVLSGTGSSDPDGDLLGYTWTGPFGTVTGAILTVVLPLGTSDITLTVDDGMGGVSSTTIRVTVEDHGAPVLTVPAALTLVRAGAVPKSDPEVLAWLASAQAVDACDVGTIMVTNDAPETFGFGTTLVTFTATDASANSASSTSTLTLVNTGPGGGTVSPVDSSTGSTPVTLTFSNVTQPGLTTLVTSTQGPPPPTGFRFGTPWVYYEIETTAIFTGPITICINYSGTNFNNAMLDALELWHHQGNGWAIVTTSHDQANHIICGTVNSLSPFAVLEPVNRPPVADAGTDQIVECTSPLGAVVTVTGTGSDPEGHPLSYAWSGASDSSTVPGLTLVLGLGIHTLSLTVTDVEGAKSTDTVVVTVLDTTPPSISGVPVSVTVEQTSLSGTPLSLPLPALSDLCDPNPTVTSNAPAVFPLGTTTVTFIATDHSGNRSMATMTVTVRDGTPPVLESVAPITAECASDGGTPVTVPRPIAIDICDGEPVVTSDAPATFPEGTTVVTFTATDASGNVSRTTTTVTVVDRTPASLGPVAAPLDPVQVGTVMTASVNYAYACGPHTALWTWDDGTQSAGTVTEGDGTGSVSGSHAYTTPGVYTVSVTVTDDDGNPAAGIFRYVVVYDPSAGSVTGGGWINSPAGAYAPDPGLTGKASFGFVSKYQQGATAPTGQTEFQFKAGNLNFHSSTYQWLVVAGARAQFKGTGTINGAGSYEFLLTAIDGQRPGGDGTDRLRIKIWGAGGVTYDNQPGAPDDGDATTTLGGGSIVIHKN